RLASRTVLSVWNRLPGRGPRAAWPVAHVRRAVQSAVWSRTDRVGRRDLHAAADEPRARRYRPSGRHPHGAGCPPGVLRYRRPPAGHRGTRLAGRGGDHQRVALASEAVILIFEMAALAVLVLMLALWLVSLPIKNV